MRQVGLENNPPINRLGFDDNSQTTIDSALAAINGSTVKKSTDDIPEWMSRMFEKKADLTRQRPCGTCGLVFPDPLTVNAHYRVTKHQPVGEKPSEEQGSEEQEIRP